MTENKYDAIIVREKKASHSTLTYSDMYIQNLLF